MHLTNSQLNAKMLIATNISTKISMDVRMLDPSYQQEDGSKLNVAAKNISDIYQKSDHLKATQLVFCDISTPNKDEDRFDIYNALKNTLVEKYNIPANEIDFIHNHDSKTARNKLFKAVNNGEIRIILGSSQKMGVGVNMQERIVAMHHLDIPWSPKDLEQRNGRGVRQGNLCAKKYNDNKVDNYIYATKGTLDAYKYFLVDLKRKFISQIKNSNIRTRKIDEGEMGEDGVMGASAFIALLSGKKELLEKNKIDKKIQELQLNKTVLVKQKKDIESKIKYDGEMIPKYQKNIKDYNTDLLERDKAFTNNDDLKYTLLDKINIPINTKKGIETYIIENARNLHKESKSSNQIKEQIIGSIQSFDVVLKSSLDTILNENIISISMSLVSKETGKTYTHGTGVINLDNPQNIFKKSFDSLKHLESKIDDLSMLKEKTKLNLSNNEELISTINVNEFDDKINDLKIKSEELSLIIQADNNSIEESMVINETILSFIKKDDFQELQKFINKTDKDKLPNLYEFINESNILSENQKLNSLERLHVEGKKLSPEKVDNSSTYTI
jgi:hypothetical protein